MLEPGGLSVLTNREGSFEFTQVAPGEYSLTANYTGLDPRTVAVSVAPGRREVRYRHVRGVTTGMDVRWSVTEASGGTLAEIVHDWTGPAWPLIRRPAADLVIGPVFIHGIASRTLAGIGRAAEGRRADQWAGRTVG